MSLMEKLLGGLIALTALAVVLRKPDAANQVLTGFGQFNESTFGMFLRS